MASVGWFQLDMDCQWWFCYGCIMVNLKRSGSLHQLFFYSFRKIVTVSKCYQIDMACFRPVAAAGQLLAVYGYDLALLQMVSDGWFQLDLDCFGWLVADGFRWLQMVSSGLLFQQRRKFHSFIFSDIHLLSSNLLSFLQKPV